MKHSRLLIDLGALSCGCTDHALESLAKSLSGEDAAGPDMWAPHDNPFILLSSVECPKFVGE
jgi:hypothetical protein